MEELQVVRDNKEVGYHKTMIMLRNPEEGMKVTQIYRKEDGKVLCCILPGDVSGRRCRQEIYCSQGECIIL